MFATNADPYHYQGHEPAMLGMLHQTGAEGFRAVLRPSVDLRPALTLAKSAGVFTLGVVAKESLPPDWNPDDWGSREYEAIAAEYADGYADLLDAVQVGNEPDIVSPSSFTLWPSEICDMGRAFRAHFPSAWLVGPGLASGNPGYLDDFDPEEVRAIFDAMAVHVYGLTPGAYPWPSWYFGVLDLTGYAARAQRWGLPLWVTEYGAKVEDFLSDSGGDVVLATKRRAEWSQHMTYALRRQPGVERIFHFCLDDAMVDGFGAFRFGAETELLAALATGAKQSIDEEDYDIMRSEAIDRRVSQVQAAFGLDVLGQDLGEEEIGGLVHRKYWNAVFIEYPDGNVYCHPDVEALRLGKFPSVPG